VSDLSEKKLLEKEKLREISEVIKGYSNKKKKRETHFAKKNGFDTLEDYLSWKRAEDDKTRYSIRLQQSSFVERKPILPELNEEESFVSSKKQKDYDYWVGVDENGNPFFDLGFIFGFGYENKKAVPSKKDMFERFLLGIGNKDPDELMMTKGLYNRLNGVRSMQRLLSKPDSVFYLDNCFDYFMGQLSFHPDSPLYLDGCSTTDDADRHDAITKVSIWFQELQHLVENDKMYWVLLSHLYVQNSLALNRTEVNKPKRLSVPLRERTRLHYELYKHPDWMGDFGTTHNPNYSFDNHIKRYDAFDDEDYITMYRSFSVRGQSYENGKLVRGKPIRKGVKKFNDGGNIHIEGNGYSYTLSKTMALKHGCGFNEHLIRKYLPSGVDKSDKEIMDTIEWWNYEVRGADSIRDGWYRAIGQFRVKKKHILQTTNLRDEDEIIANPEYVELVDYKFLNIVHLLAQQELRYFQKTRCPKKQSSKLSFHHNLLCDNLDDVYDLMHHTIKTLLSRLSPEDVKKLVTGYFFYIGKLRMSLYDDKTDKELKAIEGMDKAILSAMRMGLDLPDDEVTLFQPTLLNKKGTFNFLIGDWMVSPKKKTRNLYQPRVFEYKKYDKFG